MNVEFHYYSTAFLAVKAGFSPQDALILAHAGQYVDHHHRTWQIQTQRGTVVALPTQNFSFWDQATVTQVLAPFHFLPSGLNDGARTYPTQRVDGRISPWDVRPDSPPAKSLLLAALQSRNLFRIGLALHTYSDTWAHQNFTARNEEWNRLDSNNRLPSPGHAQAGFQPDLWLSQWEDPRLLVPQIDNRQRFSAAARKVYRYLCTYLGKDFHQDEQLVAQELRSLIDAGQGRDAVEDRVIEFILALELEPYERDRWSLEALEPPDQEPSTWPLLDRWKKVGEEMLTRAGFSQPLRLRAKPGFERTPLAAWIRAADEHRGLALELIEQTVGGAL